MRIFHLFRIPSLALPIIVATGTSAILLLGAVRSADAHGGVQVYYDEVGPYLVQAFVSVAAGQGNDYLDYSISLRNAETLSPIDDAQVAVTATMPGRSPEFLNAKRYVSTYDVLLPLEKRGGDWQAATLSGDVAMQVSITGSLGKAVYEHSLTPAALSVSGSDSSSNSLSRTLLVGLIGLAFGTMAVGVFVVLRKEPVSDDSQRRRRRHGTS